MKAVAPLTGTVTEEDRVAVEAVARVADEVLRPLAQETDAKALFPTRQLAALADLGVMGLNLPARWGGPGLSAFALSACVEAIAAACASTASALTAHFLATDSILIGGDDALRSRYLPAAARGSLLGAFALTEPRAGSNPADMRTRATPTPAGYRIEGVKHFISNGARADVIVVFAVEDAALGPKGISAFVVERGTPGLAAGAPEPTMGLRGGHVFELGLHCEVKAEQRIGATGSGFRTAMKALDNGRIEVAAMCLGIAQAAFDAAVAWTHDRQVGGQALYDYQGIQWMLADMATELRAARLLVADAVEKRQRKARFSVEAAMAKLHASEVAGRVADRALQIHGGYGYTSALPLERYVRDLRIMRIYEGSSEVQRTIIARSLSAR